MRVRPVALLLVAILLFAGTAQAIAADEPDREVVTLLAMINAEREQAGLRPLALSPELNGVAAAHAHDMIDNDFFAHNSPTTGTPAHRAKLAGVSFTKLGENLCGNVSVDAAHQLLMASPTHKANILDPKYDKVGLAVVHGSKYGLIVVEMFIQSPDSGK
ncbi:MAG: CAP domain-containing protein [Chloroflexota bacterium]